MLPAVDAVGAVSVRTLLLVDLVDSTTIVTQRGDVAAAALLAEVDAVFRAALAAHGGREIDRTDGFLALFDRPLDALRVARAFHAGLAERGLAARAAVHVGEVVARRNAPADVERGAKPVEVDGLAKPYAARLMGLAPGGRTLLGRTAADVLARSIVGQPDDVVLVDHGRYR